MGQNKDEEPIVTKAPDEGISSPESVPSAGTIAPQDTCAPIMEAEQPPQKKQIGRYEIICLLGEGGMGQVYKAYDPSLKRYVALKILRSDEPDLIERFLREARTQAQVQHEHVCKIHEVGEADGKPDGKPFISMQYIEGKTLRDASVEMTREQKIKAIMEAAEALHAAHKLGLIHRDIKPSNIMVERAEDGSYKPYIMDFGIAREQKTPGLTVTGILIGTPAYMPPEQARGDIHNLDRRTDVYALGATLYELLCGKPPFQGNTNADIVVKVMQDEPLPLRKLNPLIPEELQTIVMKCLEKDPERRYDTARALAEDLGRFLEGEPILAHPTSIYYRLYKKARKNKTVIVSLIIALLVVLTAAGYAINLKWTANKEAELSQQLGQQIEKMENILYRAYTLPLHDTRKEKNSIREMIKGIERTSQTAGYAKAPSLYAMGRGYLALNEHEKAKGYLEEAWNLGYQKPEVAYALGRIFGALYWKHLQDLEQIDIKELRDSKRKEIERLYREPALHYLKQAKGIESVAPQFVEAQIAYYENRYDEALKKARQAYLRMPDLYEARILEGDIYNQLGLQEFWQASMNKMKNYCKKATESYSAAIEIGRSDAHGYIGVCKAKALILRTSIVETSKQLYEEALQACRQALQADPENTEAYLSQSNVYNRRAEQEFLEGMIRLIL
ncbi:MAG: hypothetical protein A2Y62_21520 [Candidatus Fischerbacteria bacterium RBG_13_37_8]|uniref:non-specific serine/threonine protein kinase n=1 Tax=Candidatus Fischerbacteria bacterium RBG_13_37_8 TaxID=1817863 RepID=A0A1F5VX21_9BACT|nr:MAG: hypothetical protein A2Y62_21520 [Candidatus Fischerbacteria bacterium RBG_13_37_8]